MKALVRKYPINAKKEELNEIYTEPQWQDWIDSDGFPLTDENYGYALCEDCPDDLETSTEDGKVRIDLFDVTEHTKEVEDEMGEKQTVKFWTATYVG